MSGQVPESNPRTDYEVKNELDDIKGKSDSNLLRRRQWEGRLQLAKIGKQIAFDEDNIKITMRYSMLQAEFPKSKDSKGKFQRLCDEIGLMTEDLKWQHDYEDNPIKVICRVKGIRDKAIIQPKDSLAYSEHEQQQQPVTDTSDGIQKPVSTDYDEGKGRCDLKVSEEIMNKYWITSGNNEDDKLTPEAEKMYKLFDELSNTVNFRLLRYGKVDPSIPEIESERFADFGFQSLDEFDNILPCFILHNNLEIAIQAGNGQFIVKVPSSLNPEVQFKDWLAEHHNVMEEQYISFSLLNTVAFIDHHKNLIFVFKCDKKFRKPSKRFDNGVQFLTSGEVVIPKARVRFAGGRGGGSIQLTNTEECYAHKIYPLPITGIFKGKVDADSLLLRELADEIFCYKDEAGTPLAVIDNHAYDFNNERVRDEIFLKFYNKTGRHPNSGKIKSVLGVMEILTKYEGRTIADAPFIRDIAPSDKSAELIQQLAEILKMMRKQGSRIEMKALAETTGIDGRILGKKMKEPKFKEGLKQAGIDYSVDRLAGKNVSVIEMKLVDGVWQPESEAA